MSGLVITTAAGIDLTTGYKWERKWELEILHRSVRLAVSPPFGSPFGKVSLRLT
jgi:hypothetical protein